MTEKPGIYIIKHLASGRVYVGSASNISKRWSRHRIDLEAGKHTNIHLQAAWNKYGASSFVFGVIEFTSDLSAREQYWIDHYDAYRNGFNLCPVARSSRGRSVSKSGKRHPDPHWLHSPEVMSKSRKTRRINGTLGQKATWQMAQAIRAEYGDVAHFGKGKKQARNGGMTMWQLAEKYGLAVATVSDIIRYRTWKTDPNE